MTYGESGLVYGGLRPYTQVINGQEQTFLPYISQDSSLTLDQKLETEQGKASVSNVSISFIDYNGFMTQLCSPGVLIPDIMGCAIEVWLGFQQISYPQDFFRIFRGYCSQVVDGPGLVTLTISDPQLKMRTDLFYIAQTYLSADVGATDTVINTTGTSGFNVPILGPTGTYSQSIHCFAVLDNEFVECVPLQGPTNYGIFAQGVIVTCTNSNFANLVSLQFTGGGIAGSEIVTVTNQAILVQIQSGVSTVPDIVNALNASSAFLALGCTAEVAATYSINVCVAFAQTLLSLNYATLVYEGIVFWIPSPGPGSTFPTIQYANTVAAGSEYVTINPFGDLVINIQSGVTTSTQVLAALAAAAGSIQPLWNWYLLPNQGSVLQTTLAATQIAAGIGGDQLAVIARGQLQNDGGDPPETHSSGDQIQSAIQLGDDTYTENCIDMALKVMLSGWDGPWINGVAAAQITDNGIILPSLVDAVVNYGLVNGDYITISGASNSGNNGTFVISGFDDYNEQTNNVIYLDAVLTPENPTSAVMAFRSQYDVYPVNAGLSMTPLDIDIAGHLFIQRVFLGTPGNDLRFLMTSEEDSGKDWIGTQVYFPVGAYPVTKRGQCSVDYNKPPIANQGLSILNEDNVLKPDSIEVTRALTNRTFFNEIDWSYDPDVSGDYQYEDNVVDSASLNTIGVNTPLPINADGVRQNAYTQNLLTQRAQFYLARFGSGAPTLTVDVNWATGSVIEAGDTVTFDDQGTLQIANFSTGSRGIDNVLFEVVGRSFNMKQGNVSLNLLGGIAATAKDRFATISPSSVIVAGPGTTGDSITIEDSFGALYPGQEWLKWINYIGQQVLIHSRDYSVSATVTLLSLNASNKYILNVSSIGFTPSAGYIVDLANYSSNVNTNAFSKLMHCFLDDSVPVVTGISQTQFTIGSGNTGPFVEGYPIRVHDSTFTNDSGDLTIENITGTTVTVSEPMGFVPTAGMICDLLAMPDGGNPYRLI